MSKAQIGRCGEMLVQYRLLRLGIESAGLTTDTGIDLVAYLPRRERAVTIQVKANLAPKRAGGKGDLSLDWWVPKNSPAEMVALVDLSTEQVWLMSHRELEQVAQQQETDRLHFYVYVGEKERPLRNRIGTYAPYLIDAKVQALLAEVAPADDAS